MPTPEQLPPDFYARQITTDAMERAMAVLPPEDLPHLETLYHNPDATFSLIRPLVNPSQEAVAPMQYSISEVLRACPFYSAWPHVGIMRTQNLGVTYFDGERRTFYDPNIMQEAGNLNLAVNICAAMPESVREPLTVTAEKIQISPTRSVNFFVSLGIAGVQAMAEYNPPDRARHHMTHSGPLQTSRVPGHLAFIRKDDTVRGPQPRELIEVINAWVPKDSTVQLGPLRLRVHLPGESPYRWIR